MNKSIGDELCKEFGGDCEKATSMVNKYLDGILDENELSFIVAHLRDCPGCNHGFQFESSFHIRIRSLAPISMPSEVKENIMLALGFPGMSTPIEGSFSTMGAADAHVDGELSSQFGIPQGELPRGEIPGSDFFNDSDDTSSS